MTLYGQILVILKYPVAELKPMVNEPEGFLVKVSSTTGASQRIFRLFRNTVHLETAAFEDAIRNIKFLFLKNLLNYKKRTNFGTHLRNKPALINF